MRGFKAKALKRLALQMESNDEAYVRKGTKVKMFLNPLTGKEQPYAVTLPWMRQSRAYRLYKHMKNDLRRGGQ